MLNFTKQNDIFLNLFLGFISFVAYVVAFKLNSYVPESLTYGWIYLIFIPAGVKLICIMLFGIWGTVGDALGFFYVSNLIFPDAAILLRPGSSLVSSLMTFISISLVMKSFGINSTLSNLKYIHLPLIAALGSTIHGLVSIFLFIEIGVIHSDYLGSSAAIVLGDFIGIFVVLLAFSLTVKAHKTYRLKDYEL